ncbi:hypothetical protein QRD43_21140 [Pelomonas sp. APW6]|uniref:Uncharacterized protein n=1 Tax=Roseateles subflavus TaxID=3053353 RepID=A0ABT7LQD8_9BURK|nr:hypothetical protein [Pelomonas sp. APW6]MDL5034422.1 hypothetical protein [Pelomonas sp. APW6]
MIALQHYQLQMAGIKSLKAVLVEEASHRRGRTFEEWSKAEASAVWLAARDFAQQHDLRVPLLAEVVQVERLACGHCDYSSKWAQYVTDLMWRGQDRRQKPTPS